MPIYLGKKFRATQSVVADYSFCCARCGHVQGCTVAGVGEGVGNSPYFLDDDGAAARAELSATAAARDDAQTALDLARCPRCTRRNPRALAWFAVQAVGKAVLCLGTAFVFCAFLLDPRDTFLQLIVGGTGVACALIFVVTALIKLGNADGKVLFADAG